MTATRTRKPATRHATVTTLSDGKLVLWLTQDGVIRSYALTPLPSDFGTAFRLNKADNGDRHTEEYDVLLDGSRSTCECAGFLRWNHCKHLSALEALVKSGKLTVPAAKPQPAALPVELDDL